MGQSLWSLVSGPEAWVPVGALAAFLVLYGLLKGTTSSPAVDEEAGDTLQLRAQARAGRRLAALLSLGLVLILLAAYIGMTRGVTWSIPLFAAGFGLVIALLAANRRRRLASPGMRWTLSAADASLNAALIAGILVVLNVIAFRYGGGPLDLTREQTYSLSPLTRNQLTSLQQPVTFTMVFGQGPRAARQRDRVAQLLELYRNVNPSSISMGSLNPFTDLARNEDLFTKVPDLAVLDGGGVLIEYGQGDETEYAVVRNQDMFAPTNTDPRTVASDQFASIFTGEDAITSALIRLRDAKRAKVAFTIGHGESATSDANPSSGGLGIWRARLAAVGCDVVDWNPLLEPMPEDLSLLVIVGPREPFKPEEVEKLKAYASKGGPILAFLGNTEPSGLDEFLRSYNLEIGKGLVIDPRLNYNRNVQLVFALLQGLRDHPIIEALDMGRAVLVPNGAPIHIFGRPAPGQPPTQIVDPRFVPKPILATSPQSWAETDLKNPRPQLDAKIDEAGPATVGVAVSERSSGEAVPARSSDKELTPRLVLFSSRSIPENIVIGIEPTNLDLVMNAASWLRGRPDVLGIAPKTHVALTLQADPVLRTRLVLVPTMTAIMVIIGVGMAVYVARRN
jgi:hypothetical protein